MPPGGRTLGWCRGTKRKEGLWRDWLEGPAGTQRTGLAPGEERPAPLGCHHKQVGWAEAWDLGNPSHVTPREKGGHQLEATPVLEAGSAASPGGQCAGSKPGDSLLGLQGRLPRALVTTVLSIL